MFKKDEIFPQPMPSLADYGEKLSKEKIDQFFKDWDKSLEENQKRHKKSIYFVVLCGLIHGFTNPVVPGVKRVEKHYSWCPYEAWMNNDIHKDFNQSLSIGAQKIREGKFEKERTEDK